MDGVGFRPAPDLPSAVRLSQTFGQTTDSYPVLKVIAQDFIKLDCIEHVMPLYRELVKKTKEEPLCVSYDLFIDQKDPGHFIFVEAWPDRAALDAHCNTEHFKRLVPLIDRHQRSAGTYLLMDAFE